MKVIIHPGGKELEVPAKKRVADLLGHLNINHESVIVSREGQLITHDEPLEKDDVLEIWEAVSGG